MRAAEHETGADEHVGCETVEEVGGVRSFAMPREHDFGKGVCARRVRFDFNGDEGEEEDLPGSHCAVPHGPADSIAVGKC